MLAVSFTVSGKREEYLHRTLSWWRRVRGVQDVPLLFNVEPVPGFPVDEFAMWVGKKFDGGHVEVNEAVLDCRENTRTALVRGFATGADFVVVAEEDVEVATDILEYFSWAAARYEPVAGIKAVCAHSLGCGDFRDTSAVVATDWFNAVGWGTWKGRWDSFIHPSWGAPQGYEQGWDVRVRYLIRAARSASVFPVRSRTQHFGEVSTLKYPGGSAYLFAGTVSSCYASDYPPQAYHEVLASEVPAMQV